MTAFGCCSMHYTVTVIEGIWAATFYTKAPASSEARYPEFVLFTILAIVVSVCGMSNTVLAYDAIISRTRTAILTKRQLRSIIADKEAAEEADELKQEFISIASHEVSVENFPRSGHLYTL
ncbi:hypothetical protein PHLCEN_2v4636 [Hermanssonia centrifuga]|uniref:Uncharacterized protein n=1 Tax=Hermanssonia centrifuga TaxID=98765 RepID=A0A2R6PMV2_9APHY|nr:hypothetical protein PHLCEN_2v4636 [Hermanssonia centrifuga]